jgi:hypothetical protein
VLWGGVGLEKNQLKKDTINSSNSQAKDDTGLSVKQPHAKG